MYLLNSVGYMHSFTILQTTPHTAMYMLLITQLQKQAQSRKPKHNAQCTE